MATLTINAADSTTEIFLVASDFSLCLRPRHGTPHEVPAGIYKVRATVGRSEWQELVVLDPAAKVTVDIPEIVFGSAAPLENTNRSHESHQGAASDIGPMTPRGASASLARRAGEGSDLTAGFAFMARWWSPDATGSSDLQDPAAGVSLRTSGGGRRLVRLALDEESMSGGGAPGDPGHYRLPLTHAGTDMREGDWTYGDLGADRYTTFSAKSRPGLYTLSLPDGEGLAEQTVTLLPGWQLNVFLLYEMQGPSRGPDDRGVRRLVDLSLHYSRDRFRPESENVRLTDAARLALADERSIASRDFLPTADGDPGNPLLNLYSAHLLLVLKDKERAASKSGIARPMEFDQKLFDRFVCETARVFGADHPDVRALLTKTTGFVPDPRPVRTPPMLWRSWERLMIETCRTPEIVGSRLWRRTARRSGARPFLVWRMPQYGGERLMQIEVDITRRILLALRNSPDAETAANAFQRTDEERETLLRFKCRMVEAFDVPRSILDMIVP